MIIVPDQVAVWNERVKLSAGFINAIGLRLFGFAVLRPLTEAISNMSWPTFWWGVAGLALHVLSH